MENNYRRTKTTLSFIKYHFVFCTRYRRKIFNIPGVEGRLKELIKNICDELDAQIIIMECNTDHVYLVLDTLPNISPNDIMQKIKSNTSGTIREEFEELSKIPSLWTRNFLVSTEDTISREFIQRYIKEQKTR